AQGDRKCRVPNGRVPEIFGRVGGKGPDAHLPRSIQRQQGGQRQRWSEMDPERRRLLQRVQQAAQRLRGPDRAVGKRLGELSGLDGGWTTKGRGSRLVLLGGNTGLDRTSRAPHIRSG